MRPNIARAVFVLLLLTSILLLALGWLAAGSSPPMRATLYGLHVSLGVLASAALLAAIVLRIVAPPPPYPAHWPRWRRAIGGLSELLIYLALIGLVATGALWAAYSGAALHVFGAPLPVSDLADPPLAQALGPLGDIARAFDVGATPTSDALLAGHRWLSFLLAAAIIAHLAAGAPSRFRAQRAALSAALVVTDAPAPGATGLASHMRLLGWAQFWIQIAIALASGVLLQFSTSGRAFSPSVSGFGDAIYWSFYAFLLLCVATALAYCYTRAARRVAARADYFDEGRGHASWLLTAGLAIGLAGTLISFIGLSLSISLLIAKTVSQPPGIAITDPSKIIRALDVFILLVNFALLLAHFVGTGVAAWLAAGASRARFRSIAARLPLAKSA
ncbi:MULTISPECIES: DUF3611 family protein [Methylosinus]|uniref:Cytochrome B n=1 Tax=Methylosinus trichosporium (strain ATCC 35070 / NCIMB 11131 / UNIQEM 75 / OB3b) TaxID=595536 RepID=A0A2D2D697_METT3|nr:MULTISPECIES: DUF3611 family protein [Methylosinus]ATQ70484.1 cytochrome B [Methylosinus trichosporium OB3b]OBS51266.1 cytochrome B [Methylosinus sp. 3S-1]